MKRSSLYLTILVTLIFLAVYIRTAAPGLLSGDSAEFQLAATTLGVAHPTTYPLYTLLGHLATRIIPVSELAWRVTLVSALCAAMTVGLLCLLAVKLGASKRASLLGAIALGTTPGLWNAATVAEVYALLALLIIGLAAVVTRNRRTAEPQNGELEPRTQNQEPISQTSRQVQISNLQSPISQSPGLKLSVTPYQLLLAGLMAGLGFTHHGLFTIVALPPFAVWALWVWRERGLQIRDALRLTGGFLLGCLPWLYPLVQYWRYGPFSGADYGLPGHYYWGAPQSFGEVVDLLTGGNVRRGIFRIPTSEEALATFAMLRERALFEFGWVGLALALIGCVALWRRSHLAGLAGLWVVGATATYLFALGPAVADAPVFTLPMLLPTSLWVGFGTEVVMGFSDRRHWLQNRRTAEPQNQAKNQEPRTKEQVVFKALSDRLQAERATRSPATSHQLRSIAYRPSSLVFLLLLAAALWWGDTRVEYSSKRQLTLYRTFGESLLSELPSDAAVLAHWEQGMVLQYLRVVEGQRPDVWIDVVEPGDEAWGPRARRRYAGRPVFLIGQAPDVADMPVELVREDEYALVFRLRE